MINLHRASLEEVEVFTNQSPSSSVVIEAIKRRLADDTPSGHVYSDDLRRMPGSRMVQDTFESYLSGVGYQSSHLKKALITPFHFSFSKDEDAKALKALQEKGDHFELGTFIHQCILEPTRYSRVIVEPDHYMNSHKGVDDAIAWWADRYRETGMDPAHAPVDVLEWKIDAKRAYLAELKKVLAPFFDVVASDTALIIKLLKKHLDHYAGGIIHRLMLHSKREISFYATIDDIPLKVRPDGLQFAENIGVDAIISIKSTACEDLRSFYTFCAKYHYDLTEAMYQDVVSHVTGRDFHTTIMIMLQTVEPYAVALLLWSADDIATGHMKYSIAKDKIKAADESGIYQGYDSYADNDLGLIEMTLPRWNGSELLPSE